MREDHNAADHRRAGIPGRGAGVPGREGCDGLGAEPEGREHGVPELCSVPPYERGRQHRLWTETKEGAQTGDPGAGKRDALPGAACRF